MDWRRLFPDSDFRFPMALRPTNAAAFFAPTETFAHSKIFEERSHWLEDWDEVKRYAAATPEALNLVTQFVQKFHHEGDILLRSTDAEHLCQAAGMALEPDWVLLQPDATGANRAVAGSVCSPSGWSLRDVIGKSIGDIHAIVPGLNDALSRQIKTFLSKLEPGIAWERDNWGLSADAELNHHPSRDLKKLNATATLETTWVRVERQLLYKLPRTNALVFGIRVSNHLLSEVAADAEIADRICRALRTMPHEVAAYKGIEAARATLIEQLNERFTKNG